MATVIPLLSLSALYLILIYCVKCDEHQSSAHTSLKLDRYHDYSALDEFVKKFTKEHKNLTRLYSIGTSVKKKELYVVEVHNMHQDSVRYGIPHVKVVGNIHGDEAAGREVILHLIQYLVKSYIEGDTYIQWLVNNTRIHLLPSLNPDGFELSLEGTCRTSRGRSNARQFDLNRNFPDHFQRNTKPVQQETVAMKNWLQANTFVLSASLHSGALVANYPFDSSSEDIWAPLYKLLNDANKSEEVIMLWKKLPHATTTGISLPSSPAPDDDVFQYLASLYARTHPTMHLGNPCKAGERTFKDGIVNGASWYPITGGMQDYNYFKHGCMEITLEISCCRYPPANELERIWEENKQALLMFISQAHRGIRGIVKDKNGKPIPNAVLRIVGRNMSFNTSANGEFWRILLPGHYLLKVDVEGYDEKIVGIEVPNVSNESMPVNNYIEVVFGSSSENSNSGKETRYVLYCNRNENYETVVVEGDPWSKFMRVLCREEQKNLNLSKQSTIGKEVQINSENSTMKTPLFDDQTSFLETTLENNLTSGDMEYIVNKVSLDAKPLSTEATAFTRELPPTQVIDSTSFEAASSFKKTVPVSTSTFGPHIMEEKETFETQVIQLLNHTAAPQVVSREDSYLPFLKSLLQKMKMLNQEDLLDFKIKVMQLLQQFLSKDHPGQTLTDSLTPQSITPIRIENTNQDVLQLQTENYPDSILNNLSTSQLITLFPLENNSNQDVLRLQTKNHSDPTLTNLPIQQSITPIPI